MQRIYLPNTHFSENLCINNKEIHHQITRVMRARIGDEFVFFDGQSQRDFCYTILEISKREIHFLRENIKEKKVEVFPEMILYQALPNKLDKIEHIVQKCCEIGYSKIIFFDSERSQKLVISESKKERIQKIAIEAIEQCGGNIIPEISFSQKLWEKYISQTHSDVLNIFCHTEDENSYTLPEISDVQKDTIQIFVWPEWGFSPDEVERFEQWNFTRIHFGNRILRCETVWPVVGFYLSQKIKKTES